MKKDTIKDINCFGTTTIGERGQVVIPVEIRKKMGVKTGGKLIAFFTPSKAVVFIPVDRFGKMVSELDKKLAKFKILAK